MIEIRHSNSHSVKAKCHSNPRTTSGLVDACHVKAKFKTEIPSIVLVSQRQSHAIPRNTVLLKLLRLDHSPRQDNKHFDNTLTKRSTQTMILRTFFRNTCQTRVTLHFQLRNNTQGTSRQKQYRKRKKIPGSRNSRALIGCSFSNNESSSRII